MQFITNGPDIPDALLQARGGPRGVLLWCDSFLPFGAPARRQQKPDLLFTRRQVQPVDTQGLRLISRQDFRHAATHTSKMPDSEDLAISHPGADAAAALLKNANPNFVKKYLICTQEYLALGSALTCPSHRRSQVKQTYFYLLNIMSY